MELTKNIRIEQSADFIVKSIPLNFLTRSNFIDAGLKDELGETVFEMPSVIFNDVKIDEAFIPMGVYSKDLYHDDTVYYRNFIQSFFNNNYQIEPIKGYCTKTSETQITDTYVTVYHVDENITSLSRKALAVRTVLHGLNYDIYNFMVQPTVLKLIMFPNIYPELGVSETKRTFELLYLTKP